MTTRSFCHMLLFLFTISIIPTLYTVKATATSSRSLVAEETKSSENKSFKICSVSGGLDIARFTSSNLRNLFRGAIEDVELIREYVSEAALNQGISGGLHDLQALSGTLDWERRNMTIGETTVSAGLGFADDRRNRRIERYVGLANFPFLGSKALDLALIDSVSNIFPWIVDRKSDASAWWLSHQNGRSSARGSNKLDRLYTAAWIGTRGEAWMYYPPIIATLTSVEQAVGFGDILGPAYDSQEEEFVQPNLPVNNPERKAYFTPPYPDTAVPGLSLITAQAPVYVTGSFRDTTYDDIYIASTGVDISVASISPLLEELEGTLTEDSFAFLIDCERFDMILISQSTVEKIYPTRTGFEDGRVTRSTVDGSILNDRRNQTYLVSDTIFQSPLSLDNADWSNLAARIKSLAPGQRAWTEMDITLTGDDKPTSFYVMYENWPDVATWTLAIFAPKDQVDNAVNVAAETPSLHLEVEEGTKLQATSVIVNNGILDVTLMVKKLPPWLNLLTNFDEKYTLVAGQNITLEFETASDGSAPDHATSLIALTVSDDGYPECFHEDVLTITVEIKILYDEEFYHLNNIRIYGYLLTTFIVLTAVSWSFWVFRNKEHRIVRVSQPIFLHMMCGGIILIGISIIPLGVDDSVANQRGCSIACMSVPWFLAMGFSITFSALFSKIWRINQIVHACKNYQRVNVTARHVVIPFVVLFSLNTALLGLWTGLDPIVWTREYISGSQQGPFGEVGSVGFCTVSRSPVSLTCMILLLLLNFSALVLALFQLYKARELATEYSEGKYIAIAIGSMIQVFLTGLPILVIVQNSPQASYFVKSTIIFVVSMSLLLLTFLPKFYNTSAEQARVGDVNTVWDPDDNHIIQKPQDPESRPSENNHIGFVNSQAATMLDVVTLKEKKSKVFFPPRQEVEHVQINCDKSGSLLFPISENEVVIVNDHDVNGTANRRIHLPPQASTSLPESALGYPKRISFSGKVEDVVSIEYPKPSATCKVRWPTSVDLYSTAQNPSLSPAEKVGNDNSAKAGGLMLLAQNTESRK